MFYNTGIRDFTSVRVGVDGNKLCQLYSPDDRMRVRNLI